MENKDKKWDAMYRNKLNDFSLPVSDKVFANIKKELKLETQKKRFGFGTWLSLFLFVVGVSVAGYFVLNTINAKTETVSVSKNTASTNIIALAPKTKPLLASNTINEQSQLRKENTSMVSDKKNDVVYNKTTATPINNINNKGGFNAALSDAEVKKGLESESKKFFNNKEKKTTPADNTSKTKEKNNNKAIAGSNNTLKENKTTPANDVKKEKNSTSFNSIPLKENVANTSSENKTNTSANAEVLNAAFKPIENSTSKTNDSATNTVSKVNEPKKDSIKNNSLSKTADSINQNKNIPPVTDTNKKADKMNSFYVSITGGPSLSFRKLTTGNNAGADNRNGNEKQQTTYNAGVDVGAMLKNNLFVNVGIRLNNKSEKYHFDAITARTGTVDSTYTDSAGTHTIVLIKNLPNIPEYNVINKYQFLSIPIMVGYKFSIKDKLFIAPSIGVGIDYLLSASSSWVDTKTNQVVYYTKTNGSFSTLTVSGKINLDVGWNISNNWSLVLQPGYTRSLQSIYKKGDDLKLYPYSYDFNVGLRFKF